MSFACHSLYARLSSIIHENSAAISSQLSDCRTSKISKGSSQEYDPQWHVDRLITRGSSPYRHAFVEPHPPLPNVMAIAILSGGTATILSRPCRLKLHISNNKLRSEINIKIINISYKNKYFFRQAKSKTCTILKKWSQLTDQQACGSPNLLI